MTTEYDPKDLDTYNAQYQDGTEYVGYGLETGMKVPCPFCTAPGFMEYRIMGCAEVMAREHICGRCKRGMKAIIKKAGGNTSMEMVQTRGDGPPAYLGPIRRLGEERGT